MIIKNERRPSAIRSNARYRGPSELHKYGNFIGETVHDLKDLGGIIDRNEMVEGHRGQTDYIHDNFSAYMSGEASLHVTSNIDTAVTIIKPEGHVFEELDLMDTSWSTYNNCVKKVNEKGEVSLSSPGTLDPSGIGTEILVEEGDIIYMRLAVEVISGNIDTFTIGSHNVNQNQGSLKKFDLSKKRGIIYLDNRLYCLHREPIQLNIDVHNIPANLSPVEILIKEVEIRYLSEKKVKLESINNNMKASINTLEDKIENSIKYK